MVHCSCSIVGAKALAQSVGFFNTLMRRAGVASVYYSFLPYWRPQSGNELDRTLNNVGQECLGLKICSGCTRGG